MLAFLSVAIVPTNQEPLAIWPPYHYGLVRP